MKNVYARPGEEAPHLAPSVPPARDITTRLVASAIGLGLLAGVAAHLAENESVLFVGPILIVLSISILWLGIRSLELASLVLGISCLAFVVSTAAVVWLFSWSPSDGEMPILVMSVGYSAVGVPLSLWIAITASTSADKAGEAERRHGCGCTLAELDDSSARLDCAKKKLSQKTFADMEIPALAVGLLVAAVWGYFSDLRNGQIEWFIGRLVFVSIVIVAVWRVTASRTTPDAPAKAG